MTEELRPDMGGHFLGQPVFVEGLVLGEGDIERLQRRDGNLAAVAATMAESIPPLR
ncbi:MAG: hypothetical protein R2864_11185 [Syntrophotaleaceae bacterium]